MPYIIGLAFGKQRYWALSALMTTCVTFALCVALASWRRATRWITRSKLPSVESDLYCLQGPASMQMRMRPPLAGEVQLYSDQRL